MPFRNVPFTNPCSELSRFETRDPIGLAGGDYNFFRYVGNMPTFITDPSGEFWWWLIIAAGAAFGLSGCSSGGGPPPAAPVGPGPVPRGGRITAAICRQACMAQYPKNRTFQKICIDQVCKVISGATCTGLNSLCNHLLRHRQKQAAEACLTIKLQLCPGMACNYPPSGMIMRQLCS